MYIYPDNGCKESPTCLKCKLPQCVYDLPKGDRPTRLAPRGACG